MGTAGSAIPGRFDAKQRSTHLPTAPYKTLCSKRGATTCRREEISFLKIKTKCVTVLYLVIRPLPLQLHTLLKPFFAARDVFIDRLLRDRVPGLPHIFFSKNVKNVKIFCVVVAFKAESGSISTKKNNTGQYVQVVAKIFDGVF